MCLLSFLESSKATSTGSPRPPAKTPGNDSNLSGRFGWLAVDVGTKPKRGVNPEGRPDSGVTVLVFRRASFSAAFNVPPPLANIAGREPVPRPPKPSPPPAAPPPDPRTAGPLPTDETSKPPKPPNDGDEGATPSPAFEEKSRLRFRGEVGSTPSSCSADFRSKFNGVASSSVIGPLRSVIARSYQTRRPDSLANSWIVGRSPWSVIATIPNAPAKARHDAVTANLPENLPRGEKSSPTEARWGDDSARCASE